jgi:type IV pilus assembly protein PilN
MIRINLLGTPRKKGKRAVVATSEGGAGGAALGIGLLLVLAAVAGNGFYYWKLTRDASAIEQKLKTADAENRRLSEVKSRYLEREKIKDFYKRRVDVIDQLRNNQFGPVTLLNTVAGTVNTTDEVWLSTMTNEGGKLNLKGVALSVHGVADLMRNLQRTGYFKSVEIKETYQDDKVKDMQAFVFTILCEMPGQTGPTPPPTGKKS